MSSASPAPDEVERLRRCLNDLVGILALPTLWSGGEPRQIASVLLDALTGMLPLAFAYARLEDRLGGPAVELIRLDESLDGVIESGAVVAALRQALGGAIHPVPQLSIQGADLNLAHKRLGVEGEIGLVVIGSRRRGFPEQIDMLLLEVAANQAALGLQQLRLLNEQRRMARELDERVAQRTRQLAAAHEQLQRSEYYWHMVVDNIPGMVALLSPAGAVEIVNRQLSEYFGQTLEELRQWGTNDTIHSEDLPHVVEVFGNSISTGTPYEILQRFRRRDGVYRWFTNKGFPLRDAEGRILRWCVLLTDIDERKRAEAALRESEYASRLIVDSIPGLITVMSPEGELERVSLPVDEYFGAPFKPLRRWADSEAIHPEDRAQAIEAVSLALASGDTADFEARLRRFDGVYRWFHIRGLPLRDRQGRIVRWYFLNTDVDERKRAEEALKSRERDLNLIIDTIPALVWCNLPEGPNEFLSKSWHEYTGLTPEESHGWGWQASFHPDDLPPLMKRWGEMLITGEPGEIESRLRRHDGVYRWFLIRAEPFRDDSGKIIRWYGTSTDIEDRKRAEQELESRGRDLKLIIDTIPTLAWSTEADGFVDFLSRRWLEFTGLSAEEALGFGWAVAVHPEDAPGLLAYWQSALDSGAPVECEARLRRFDGAYRWFLFRASAMRDEAGRIIKWYGTNTDIEDRKRAEEEVRRKEAFLAKAQRLSLSGSFSWRVATGEVTFSDEAYRIFEFERGTLVTLELIASRVHPEDRALLADKLDVARGAGGDQTYAIRLRMPDGSTKYLRASSQDTFDESGHREYVGAVQDVTARHLAEESLDQARSELAHVSRVTAFSTLTASIAHEINQPLSGIITNASTCLRMLDAEPPNVDGARETARRTIRDGNRASDVIARLRALFSKKEITLEPMDLNEATRDVLAMTSIDIQRQHVVLQSELAENLPLVGGDRVQLQQVILNLLRNALDAMAEVNDRPRQLLIRTAVQEDGFVRLSVRDSGVGLSGQNLDRIFDSFYTTKRGGMGIGLSVSRSIIEKHHGRLWAEDHDGPGARFSFTIPVSKGNASTAALEKWTE